MKTLNDVRSYAETKGMTGISLERLIDEIESDGRGNLKEGDYEDICFGIDCETEN